MGFCLDPPNLSSLPQPGPCPKPSKVPVTPAGFLIQLGDGWPCNQGTTECKCPNSKAFDNSPGQRSHPELLWCVRQGASYSGHSASASGCPASLAVEPCDQQVKQVSGNAKPELIALASKLATCGPALLSALMWEVSLWRETHDHASLRVRS